MLNLEKLQKLCKTASNPQIADLRAAPEQSEKGPAAPAP
jgi:hypothetical protein